VNETAALLDGWNLVDSLERRVHASDGIGERHPQLYAVQRARVLDRRLFRVCDATAGGHYVYSAGSRDGFTAETVVVKYFAVQ
jgi:hypothetical protein